MLLSVVLPLVLFPTHVAPTCSLEVVPRTVLEERVLRDFTRRVDRYVRLHRRLERSLPPEHLFNDLDDMSFAVDALHAALTDARPHAQPGTIFTPAIADLLAGRLEGAVAAMGLRPIEVVIAMNLGYRARMPELQINDRFPDVRQVPLFPGLLATLPDLPPELQYRLVDRDLLIVDTHADLIVDILTNALPAPYGGPES
jgi:hypothetical protein